MHRKLQGNLFYQKHTFNHLYQIQIEKLRNFSYFVLHRLSKIFQDSNTNGEKIGENEC